MRVIHGKRYTYDKHRCRCEPCTDAKSQYQRDYRHRTRPPRIASVHEAATLLEAIQQRRGYSDQAIAEATGISTRTILRIRHQKSAQVRLSTLELIERFAIQEGIYP